MNSPNSVIKSPNDNNEYYTSTLPNGIKYFIISDSEADKSAASINIAIGYLHNPVEIEGLAHFLEHTLFLGTEKYPGKNEFGEFLSKNSGSTNAYTSIDSTNFHFDISNEEIETGLDMFSQFFISPLFTKELIEKELKAIDSEYKMDIRDDRERVAHLICMEGNPNSPLRKFNCGCLQTLQRDTIRDDVIKFYQKYYHPKLMNLCVYSNKPIDEMKKIIEDKFNVIKPFETNTVPPENHLSLYTNENMGYFYKIIPVKNLASLEFCYSINVDANKFYSSSPFEYIVFILAHEGENSLTSYLRRCQYIFSLICDYTVQASTDTELTITIELTPNGYDHYEDIIAMVVQYIERMQKDDVIESYFREIQKRGEIDFAYFEKSEPLDVCIETSENLMLFPPEKAISVNYLVEEYDPKLIKEMLSKLTPKNLNVFLLSQKNVLDSSKIQTEKWFNIKYTKESLVIKQDVEFGLKGYPVNNIFIPNTFDLINYKAEGIEITPYPKKIEDNEHIIWYKGDDMFKMPKVYMSSRVYISNLNMDISKFNAYATLWLRILNDEISEIGYLGELSQNSFSIHYSSNSININIVCFSDTIENYVSTILKKIVFLREHFKSIEDIDKKYSIKLEKLIKEIINSRYDNVETQSYTKLSNLLLIPYVNKDTKLVLYESMFKNHEETQEISSEFLSFISSQAKKTKFEWLVQGNITSKKATEIISRIESSISQSSSRLTLDEIRKCRIVSLPENHQYIYEFTSCDKENENSNFLSYYQVGNLSLTTEEGIKVYSGLRLIEQIFSEDFFDEIRTKEQIGYYVTFSIYNVHNIFGFVCFVQSTVVHPKDIARKVEDFFLDFDLNDEENFTQEDFESYKSSLINLLKEKDLTLAEEFERNYNKVYSRDYNFDRKEKVIACLEKEITRDYIIELFNNYIFKNQRRIDIYLIGKDAKEKEKEKMQVDNEEEEHTPSQAKSKVEVIKDIQSFHSKAECFDKEFY